MSPLARCVRSLYSAENNFSRMASRAQAAGVYATAETFRKAANDGYRTPLREQAVIQLAKGLGMTAAEIRALDSQRWGVPQVGGITEEDVIAWIRDRLEPHLADHIIAQYFILLDASQNAPPIPRLGRDQSRGSATGRTTQTTESPLRNGAEPAETEPVP